MRLFISLLWLIGSMSGLSVCSPDRPRTEAATATAVAAAKNSPAAADTTCCAYPEERPPAAFTIRHPAWSQQVSTCEVNIRQYSPEDTFREFERAQ